MSPGSLDEPLGRVQRHQLFLRRQFGADGGRLEQHRQRQYARLFAGDRECRDQFLRRRRRRVDHSRGQRGAPRAGLELDLAGRDQQAISDGLATLAQTVDDSSSATSTSGANQNGASPSAMLANLQSALATYAVSPTSSSAADAVVSAASDLASSLNSGSATVQQVREQADQNMASSVGTINSLLEPVHRRQQRRRDRTSNRRQCRQRRGHARLRS